MIGTMPCSRQIMRMDLGPMLPQHGWWLRMGMDFRVEIFSKEPSELQFPNIFEVQPGR